MTVQKKQRNPGKVDQHKKNKSIEITDNVNLAKNSVLQRQL